MMKIEGPFGDFRLHHAQRPAVLLAGGIGITPFRSILVEAIRCGSLPYSVALFHANGRPEGAPFTTELTALSLQDDRFRFIPTMTALTVGDSHWTGERGRIDGPMLRRHVADFDRPIYYVAGPAGMVRGARATLESLGVDEDDIRTEEFTGY
jgi:ferredoxin-NADP reductase